MAPLALNVVELPLQIVKDVDEAATVGVVTTVTVMVLLETHPAALVPFTV